MDDKLRLAMVAARAGQNKEAQFLLTQVLQENPQETNAWFLLSHLVDSEEKKIAYLEKVVALDPSHEKAAAQLAELTLVSALPASEEPITILADQSEEEPASSAVDSMPDDPDEAMGWLEGLAATATEDEIADAPELGDTIITDLSEPSIEVEPEATETAVTTAATIVPSVRPEPAADDTSTQLQRLNITLAILVVLMIIVLYFLITVLF